MRASEWRVLALRLWMWDMIGCWQVHECICDGACVVRSSSTVALPIFALFAEWCSRACAGESCVLTSVFWRMQAHSELILNARWCGFEEVRLSVAFSRGCAATRVTRVSMCHKQACESGSRASTHGVGWTSGMAWCVACPLWPGCKRSLCFSCCMLSHNRVRAQVNVELWRFC